MYLQNVCENRFYTKISSDEINHTEIKDLKKQTKNKQNK